MRIRLALVLSVAVFALIAAPSAFAASWSLQTTLPPGTWHLAAGDSTHAWAVSSDGRVARTGDGNTWTAKTLPSFVAAGDSIADVYACDRYNVWAVGKTTDADGLVRGLIYRTTDGGWNWKRTRIRLYSADTVCKAVALATPLRVYIAGGPYVLRSLDGGATWKVVYSTRTWNDGDLNQVAAERNGSGVWVGGWGGLAGSLNGGDNWARPSQFVATDLWEPIITDLSAPGPATAYAVQTYVGDDAFTWTLWGAANGGATWSKPWHTQDQNTEPTAMWFGTALRGWLSVVDYTSAITAVTLRTFDGGLTWKAETVPGAPAFSDLAGAGTTLWGVAGSGIWVRR